MSKSQETITSKIWFEEPVSDNPFVASKCYCSGFDLYGDLLGKISWSEYLYLLFKLEPPSKQQAELLETIAVAIANPGIRDPSVRAAMNAGVGGSTSASSLMAALAVGAGQLGGSREVLLVMQSWLACGTDLASWNDLLTQEPVKKRAEIWLPVEHPPGFDPNGTSCPEPVLQTLHKFEAILPDRNISWLREKRNDLEQITGCPLAFTGLVATALHDLEFTPEQGEMLYLMLRLPGAAVHALEQKHFGWKKYPFFIGGLELSNDPGSITND